jgi:hypothetical protein
MQVSNSKNAMQDTSDNSAKKVTKKVTNTKMSKNPKAAASSNSTAETYRESSQNVRLDTSESDEESVSEVMESSKIGLMTKFRVLNEKFSTSHRPSSIFRS